MQGKEVLLHKQNSPAQDKTGFEIRRKMRQFRLVSRVDQIKAELQKLSQAELRQVGEWLDNILEDELEFTPEFEAAIQRSEEELTKGERSRVRRQ